MAVDPYIARGVAPIDVSGSLAQIAAMQQRDRALNQDQQRMGAVMAERQQSAQAEEAKARGLEALSKIEWALQSGNPRAAILSDPSTDPKAREQFSAMSDEQVSQLLTQLRGQMASQLGIRPEEPKQAGMGALYKVDQGGRPVYLPAEQASGKSPYQEPERVSGGESGERPGGKAPSGYRWGPDGNLLPIPGGPADPTGPGARRNVQPLRKEFEGLDSVKNFKTALPLLVSARKAPDNGYGDLQLIYTAGKILDPNSVVREGELALTIAAGSPLQRIIGSTRFSIEKGGRLTPQSREQLLGMVNERVLAYRQAYDQDRTRFAEYAQEAGGTAAQVVGGHPANAFKGGNTRKQAPPEAIEFLKQNPKTAGAFKAKYGYLP